MRIVFFGTSEFAVESLRQLIASRHEVVALVTQPDRKKGRSLKISPPATKVLAATKDMPVYQPDNASSSESVSYLKKLNADLFVVVAFGQILKKEVLEIPKIFAVNLHGSILPRYRGAAPTNWAIINGDKVSGITIIRMNERLDEGDIILKREYAIDPEDTNITLSEKLADMGAKALIEVMDTIEDKDGKIDFTRQDDAKATYAPKLKKESGEIRWNEPALAIDRKVKGLIPWPGAYTRYERKVLKILASEVSTEPAVGNIAPGEVIDIVRNKGIVVTTGNANIVIKYLQLEGKKVLDADSFLRGHRISIGYHFK